MTYSAIIFDLFGTLVDGWTRTEFDGVYAQMAESVSAPYDAFYHISGEIYPDTAVGKIASIEENIAQVCHLLNLSPSPQQIAEAANHRYTYTRKLITPDEAVLKTLRTLKHRGLNLGLISDCSPDVPHLWPENPLSDLIDQPTFSCKVGLKKPDPEIYLLTCRTLGVPPNQCLYVGDGSSQELTGAARVGLHPILKKTSLEDVYDQQRPDVEQWQHAAIDHISELIDLLT